MTVEQGNVSVVDHEQNASVKAVGLQGQKPLVDLLATVTDIDVDTMDTSYAEQIAGKPCDMTSNQFVTFAQMTEEQNAAMVDEVIGKEGERGWEWVLCKIAVLLCKRVLPIIRERVYVQVSPRGATSKEETLRWARMYAEAFAHEGVPTSRYAIKIPTTGAGMCAAAELLDKDGIRSLATIMFGVPQAIAASQAGCYAISPYFNEINVHIDKSCWPNVDDPLIQHPMIHRMAQIVHAYKNSTPLNAKAAKHPQVKPASFLSWQEALACAQLKCDNVTLLSPVLDQLMIDGKDSTVVSSVKQRIDKGVSDDLLATLLQNDPLSNDKKPFRANFSTDYLANNGEALDKAIQDDLESKRRLQDAVALFSEFEEKCKAFIEEKWAQEKCKAFTEKWTQISTTRN